MSGCYVTDDGRGNISVDPRGVEDPVSEPRHVSSDISILRTVSALIFSMPVSRRKVKVL